VARLSRRLVSLESRISPDRPKLIFILPYVDPSELVSGITVQLCGKSYDFDGNSVEQLLDIATQTIQAIHANTECHLVFISYRIAAS